MTGLRFEHESRPGRVSFGAGEAAARVVAEIDLLGAARVLVVASDRDLATVTAVSAGVLDRVVGRFSRVRRHVPSEIAEAAVALARETKADAVLAIGGGSTTGTAKIIARDTAIPLVAVPTTFAGSEMTPVWGVTVGGRKTTGVDPRVQPRAVVYDSDLVATIPDDLAIPSAFNALAHCVEAVWAVKPNPVVRSFALEGIRRLGTGLRALAAGDRASAIDDLLAGSMFGGMSFGATGSGLHHKICHALGGAFDLPHAPLHTVVLPRVVEFTATGAPAEARLIADALDGATAPEALADLVSATHAPRTLRQIGLAAAQVDRAVEVVVARLPIANARPVDAAEIEGIVRAAAG
jgi:maleylacetate reductase